MREVSQRVTMMTFPTSHLYNAKPSEKDHDLPGTRTRDNWSSSQHTQPLHHLGRMYSVTNVLKENVTFILIFNSMH
jgi:hypothetical protein